MEQLHTKPFKMMEWKDCDFMFDMKNGGSDWDFNREIQLVFLHPPSSAVTLDEEQRLSPEDSINSAPSFLQWHRAARRWNSWTNRDLFLPEWGEKHQSISIFIFSHSFYFPSVCILYTWLRLCLLMWYIYIYTSQFLHYQIQPMTQKAPASHAQPVSLLWDIWKQLLCAFSIHSVVFSLTTK